MKRIIHWYRAWKFRKLMKKINYLGIEESGQVDWGKLPLNISPFIAGVQATIIQTNLIRRPRNWNKFGFRHFNWRYFMRTKYGYALDVAYLYYDLTHKTVNK